MQNLVNCKAIDLNKHNKWYEDTRLYNWYVDSWLWNVVSKMHDLRWKLYGKFLGDAKKTVQWYWNVFRFDYDFDAHSIYAIINYKLIRIKASLESGYSIQEDRDIHALDLAIKLSARLKNDDYETAFVDRHDKKWGEPIYSFKDKYFHSSRPNVNTDEEKELERKNLKKAYEAAYAARNREVKWLFGIIQKYERALWD